MFKLRKKFLGKIEIYPKSNSIYYFFFLSLILIMCYYTYTTGPVVHTGYVYDTLLVLDGASRAHQGQIQGVDFHSLQGPLFFHIIAAFMHSSHGITSSIVSANIFMTLFLTAITLIVFIPRTSCVAPIAIALSTSLLCLGAYALGVEPAISYAMLYNRYCYAILFIIIAETAFPAKKNYCNEIIGAIAVGILLPMLFFIKYTYFFVGLAFLIYKVIIKKTSHAYILSVFFSFIISSIIIAVTCRFNCYHLVLDYLVPYYTSAFTTRGSNYGLQKIKPHLQSIIVAFGMLTFYLKLQDKNSNREKLVDFIYIISLLGSAIALAFTNYGNTDMPLLVILSIVLLELTVAEHKKLPSPSCTLFCTTIFFIALVFPFAFNNLSSLAVAREGKELLSSGIAFAKEHNRNDLLKFMEIDSVVLSNFYIKPSVGIPNIPCIDLMNDGLQLVKNNTKKEDSIGAFFFANYFNIALDRALPRKASLYWDFGMTFDKKVFPDPVTEFGELNYIMVPKKKHHLSSGPMLDIYSDYLKENFSPLAESKYWTLLKRKEVN